MDKGGFGPHIVLDLNECDPDRLGDLNLIFDLLNSIPDKIGMHKITQPYVFPYAGLVPEDRGITGMVIIAESHLAIHTFQDKAYCFCDIFSCKPFDYEEAKNLLIEAFGSKKPSVQVMFRGEDFPRSPALSA